MKRLTFALLLLVSVIVLTRAAPPPPIYPGVVPYEQLDTRNFELADYPVLRIMPFMPRGAPPYLAVDTWSFAINTNNWNLYGFNPLDNTWHHVANMNPTDGFVPFRQSETEFADSGWYHISTNRYSFGGFTNQWLCVPDMASGLALGYLSAGLTNGTFPEGTIAIGDGVMPGVRGAGTHNIGIGESALNKIAEGYNNIAIGTLSLGKTVDGAGNIAIGPGGLPNLTSGSLNIDIGTGNTLLTTEIATLSMAGGRATNSFDMVIGIPSHQRIMFPIASYTGTGAKVLTDDGTFHTASSVITGAISSQLLWTNSPTGTGTADAGSSNIIASLPTGLRNATLINTADAFAVGEDAGFGSEFTQSTNIYNIGRQAGWGNVFTNAWMVMNVGDMAGAGMRVWDSRDVHNFGLEAGYNSWVTNGSYSVQNIGELSGEEQSLDAVWGVSNYGWKAGHEGYLTNTLSAYNYGDVAGEAVTISDSLGIYNFGEDAGGSTTWNTVTNIHAFGASPLYGASGTNLTSVYAFGTDALSLAGIINSTNVYAWGTGSGLSLSGDGYSDIYLFGGGSQPTRMTNEFVFGDADYQLTVPGHINGDLANAINVKAPPYNAKGDGTTDDTAALQLAFDHVNTNGVPVYIPTGTYLCTTTLIFSPTNAYGARLVCDGVIKSAADPAIRIGDHSGYRGYYTVNNLSLTRPTRSDTGVGLELVNLFFSKIDINQVTEYGTNVTMIGDTVGFVYNDIYPGSLRNGMVNLYLGISNAGWCNENRIHGGRYWWQSALPSYVGRSGIYIDGSSLDNNRFYGPTFEGPGDANALAIVLDGVANVVRDARVEGTGPITVPATSSQSIIEYGWGVTAATVNDLGTSTVLKCYNLEKSSAAIQTSSTITTTGGNFQGSNNLTLTNNFATVLLVSSSDTNYMFGMRNNYNSTNRWSLLGRIGNEVLRHEIHPTYGGSYTLLDDYNTPFIVRRYAGQTNAAFVVEDSAPPDLTPFLIDQYGNTGIGTQTPSEKLQVVGNVSVTQTNFASVSVTTNHTTMTGGFTSSANSTNNAQLYIDQLITPSMRLRRYVTTHAGTITLDFATNTIQKLVLTGAVTFAFSNLETNRTYDLRIANSQATNCTITWSGTTPIFEGYSPTYVTAGKHARLWFDVDNQTNTTVFAQYAEQQ